MIAKHLASLTPNTSAPRKLLFQFLLPFRSELLVHFIPHRRGIRDIPETILLAHCPEFADRQGSQVVVRNPVEINDPRKFDAASKALSNMDRTL
jgi:hypothetical protein